MSTKKTTVRIGCKLCSHIKESPAHDKPHGQMLTTGFKSHPFQ